MSNRVWLWVLLLATACARPPQPTAASPAGVVDRSVSALQQDLQEGRVTSAELVEQYQKRIAALDVRGPALHSVLSLNPDAGREAALRDRERAQGQIRGPLHGIPVLIKDNIETSDPLPTTAGSLALARNLTGRDALAVARLRAQGAVVLGKTNLSEWANIRSSAATSGWSALGGLTRNPYVLDRNACGSSSGSAVAVAAGLAPVALGTETDGSITCPASLVGVVGLKPTLGLVSTAHVIPITAAQDTVGPIALSVSDLALLLNAIAERTPRVDYQAQLSAAALRGKRLGIMKFHTGFLASVDALFERAVQDVQALGASVVAIDDCPELKLLGEHELPLMLSDFRREIDAYLQTTPPAVGVRSLQDVVAFDRQHAQEELPYFDQALFERALSMKDEDTAQPRRELQQTARAALDRMLAEQHLDALIAPTMGPAWTTDLVNGDHALGGAMQLPAVAGYPHLTVPMGTIRGLPVGLSFVGAADSEAELLAYGYAYEQRTHHRRAPFFLRSLP